MMDINEIKKLITAFYNCETNAEEEQKLLEYFSRKDIPEELLDEKRIFLQMYDADTVEVPSGLESKLNNLIDKLAADEKATARRNKNRLVIWVGSAAACIALFISVGLYFYDKPQENKRPHTAQTGDEQYKDTFSNPNEAYMEARRALALVSSNFNKGISQMEVVSSGFEKTNEVLNKTFNRKKEKES